MRVALVLVAACGSDAAVIPDAPMLPADLLLYYPMDEPIASGTLRDAAGHRDGQCTGGSCPTALEIGLIGGALIFDGDDMIHIQSPAELDAPTDFTVAMWVGRDGAGPACLVGKRAGTTDGNTWQLCIDASNVVTLTSYNGTSNVVTSTPSTLTASWNHLALTWDASTQTETFYFGGDLVGSHMATKEWDTGPLLIGGDVDNDTPTAFFTGVIDDVRVYSRALTAAEIRDVTRL